ncbi:MAG: desulfoferrodoxin [Nanoarchaeota archaeon]
MVNKKEVYICNVCGNVIEVLHASSNNLVCCGQPMNLMEQKSEGENADKHSPVIEKDSEGVKVKVGKVEHPMEENHYIEWIEISTEKGESKKFLKPGEKPEAVFPVKADIKHARMFCNIHGLWENQK